MITKILICSTVCKKTCMAINNSHIDVVICIMNTIWTCSLLMFLITLYLHNMWTTDGKYT